MRPSEAPATYSDTERAAAAKLVADNYELLVRLARSQRRRARLRHTMETSDVLHEALARLEQRTDWASQQHFIRASSLAIRSVIIDHARRKLSLKRGAGQRPEPFNEQESALPDYGETPEQIVAIGRALETLEAENPRWVQIIDARYFAGLTETECAEALGLSPRTVRREWKDARQWLARELDIPD